MIAETAAHQNDQAEQREISKHTFQYIRLQWDLPLSCFINIHGLILAHIGVDGNFKLAGTKNFRFSDGTFK